MIRVSSLEPTSDRTVNSWAKRSISSSLRSWASVIVPSEISMCSRPSSCSQATSSLEPVLGDRQLGQRAAEDHRDPVLAVARELAARDSPVTSAVPQPELDEIHEVARDLDQPVDLCQRQPAVEHVRDPQLPGLGLRSGRSSRSVTDPPGLLDVREVRADRDHDARRAGARRRAGHGLRVLVERLHRCGPELQCRGDRDRVRR